VVVLLAMTAPQAYGEDLLQTIDVESVDQGKSVDPSVSRGPVTLEGQGLYYSGNALGQQGARPSREVQIGDNVKLPNPASYYAVTHIAIEEEQNNPCRISLWGRMVDEGFRTQERKLAQFALDTCKIDKDLERALSDNGIKDRELTGFGARQRFIRGLSVCMGGARNPLGEIIAIKGLRLKPAAVNHTESRSLVIVQSEDEVDASQQANCPEARQKEKEKGDSSLFPEGWASWNMCPDDQVLIGVNVYFTDKEFTALGVRCKGLKGLSAPQAPVQDRVGY